MTYTSIISFFEYCGINWKDAQPQSLQRIKKQIAAEFAMAENGIITINNVVYNKQDVLQIIEAENAEAVIAAHQKIDEYPELKQFLERGVVDGDLSILVQQEKSNEPFIRLLSPMFAPAFNREMKKRLTQYDFEAAARWIPACQLILTTDGEQAFQSTHSFLEDSNRLFKNINKHSFLERYGEIKPWTGNWSKFLNWLPDMLFSVKETLAVRLLNLCVEIQHTDYEVCYLISKQLTELDFLDDRNTELIWNNHQVYESKVPNQELLPPERRKQIKKEKSTGVNYIWVIIVVILSLVRMASTCNDNNSRSSNYNSYEYTGNNTINAPVFKADSMAVSRMLNFGREAVPKIKPQKTIKGFEAKKPVLYLAFLNDFTQTSTSYTFKLNNRTGKNYVVFVLHDGEVMDILLEQNNSTFITLNKKINQDLILAPQHSIISEYAFGNQNEQLYFAPPGMKQYSQQFNQNNLLDINNPAADNILNVDLTLSTDDKLYISSDELSIITTEAPDSNPFDTPQ